MKRRGVSFLVLAIGRSPPPVAMSTPFAAVEFKRPFNPFGTHSTADDANQSLQSWL